MIEKILFVDDDIDILRGLKRNLIDQFNIDVAQGGAEGLNAIVNKGPFAIVVSDYRMPEMDGIKFLELVRQRTPDTVRMMLTGFADLNATIDVINRGGIFRFLTKPCSPEELSIALNDGLKQSRLIHAERELLENTLTGSIQLMSELMGLLNPVAFSRSMRVHVIVKKIVEKLHLSDPWQYEVAAMLSQIGCVMISPEILEKAFVNDSDLTMKELKLIQEHPETGQKLLSKIPRLERTAGMISRQKKPYDFRRSTSQLTKEEKIISMGADILKATLDYDSLVNGGSSCKSALALLRQPASGCNPDVIEALGSVISESDEDNVRSVYVRDLCEGMILHEHLRAAITGTLLATKGQQVNSLMIERLKSFEKTVGIEQPFYVLDGG
ncbi:HD domain-containing phosphohydrolase [Calditrichota bacterium]